QLLADAICAVAGCADAVARSLRQSWGVGRSLGKLASVFTVGGLCVDGCRTIGSVTKLPSVSLALNALTRCELQRASAGVLANVQRFARMAAGLESRWLRTSRDSYLSPARRCAIRCALEKTLRGRLRFRWARSSDVAFGVSAEMSSFGFV